MGKRVTTIPATISKFTASLLTAQKKRKVATYARVSTDHEEQGGVRGRRNHRLQHDPP